MAPDERGAAFLREVADKTAAKKLKWREMAEEGIFVTSLAGKYAVKIYPYERVDAVGRPVGKVSLTLWEGSDILLDVTKSSEGVTEAMLQSLYAFVERQVNRIDEKNASIQDALSQLKNL